MRPLEVIILAGGLGTRLRTAIGETPKLLAPIGGIPFIEYLLHRLSAQGTYQYIFSLGYGKEEIKSYLSGFKSDQDIRIVEEEEPLGTGGAIKKALSVINGEQVLILNGDTLADLHIESFLNFHQQHQAECSIALRNVEQTTRYGQVVINDQGLILRFMEKEQSAYSGLINTGAYLLDCSRFRKREPKDRFSFEKDYLSPLAGDAPFYGYIQEGFFMDIGTPEDFLRSQHEIKRYDT